jgi:D-alanine transaminase
MKDVVFLNGRFIAKADAVVPVDDRGYQFADGVYEVMKFYGRRPLRIVEHLQRLRDSCEALRIEGGPTTEEWQKILAQLAVESELPDDASTVHILYLQITRGVARRNHLFPAGVEPTSVAYFMTAPVYSPEQRENGVALMSHPDERWSQCHIKSIALLPCIMAKQAAREAGAFEALLVKGSVVTEGSSTNAFCVRNGAVYTHPQSGAILPGVTRTLVQQAAARAGVGFLEQAITLAEYADADEAFLSSTTMNVMPVTRLDNRPIGDGKVGCVTRRVAAAVDEIIAEEVGSQG